MTPTKELREVIRRALDVPRVVGAGIGARQRCAADGSCEPVLTIMVEEGHPADQARIAKTFGCHSGRPVEIMEVGRVSALLLERPKA